VGNEEEKLLPETLLSFPQIGGLPGEGGAMHTFEVREEVGVVASEVRKEFRVFIEPQELTDDLDSEYFAVAESRSGSRTLRRPSLATRSSMRQKTATMKVLRSIRRRSPLRLYGAIWLTPSVGRSSLWLKSSRETCTRG
jgi:hypothetical protein